MFTSWILAIDQIFIANVSPNVMGYKLKKKMQLENLQPMVAKLVYPLYYNPII